MLSCDSGSETWRTRWLTVSWSFYTPRPLGALATNCTDVLTPRRDHYSAGPSEQSLSLLRRISKAGIASDYRVSLSSRSVISHVVFAALGASGGRDGRRTAPYAYR